MSIQTRVDALEIIIATVEAERLAETNRLQAIKDAAIARALALYGP